MPGFFQLDLMCKIGIQGIWKSAPQDLSHQLSSASAAPLESWAGSESPVVLTPWATVEKQPCETSLQQCPSFHPPHLPSIQHITSQHQIFMNPPTRSWLLQVAVTSVIAGDFPLQRKIVFIMCHAHTVKQVFGLSGFPRAGGKWDFT